MSMDVPDTQSGLDPNLEALIRWASDAWAGGDHDLSAVYLEEWSAVLVDCPGPATRWRIATGFALGAAAKAHGRLPGQLYEAVCSFRARHLKRIERIAVAATFVTIPVPFVGDMVSQRTGSSVPLYVALPVLLTTILLNILWLGRRALRPRLFRRRQK